jgi:hypothetical protein
MMSTRTRVRFCAIVVALGLWVSGLGLASAEPSAGCRALATRFANTAAELDLGDLAGLITCVSVEMQDRTGDPAVAPLPSSSAPPSSPPISERGQWPPPAPWGGPWPGIGPSDR